MEIFRGLGTAMVTPFTENGINYTEAEKLIEFLIAGGNDALIVLGTTGEASTMSPDEKRDFIKFAVEKVNKRIPVIVGTGANNTVTAMQQSMQAQDLGADGLLVVTPFYNKCTQNGLIKHYEYIASRVRLPIIAYNVPGRTGMNMLPQTAVRLSKAGYISGIKEASGNIAQIQELLRIRGKELTVYIGDDGLTMAGMMLGAEGLISVASNAAPSILSRLTKSCLKNDVEEARKIQLGLLPFINALFSEVNPAPVKKALQLLGIDAGLPRLPLLEIENDNLDKLKTAMTDLDLI